MLSVTTMKSQTHMQFKWDSKKDIGAMSLNFQITQDHHEDPRIKGLRRWNPDTLYRVGNIITFLKKIMKP